MVFIIRDSTELSRPDTAVKLIKARDFWAFKEAERALAEAQEEKARILSSAREAYEAERQRGYAEGNESARLQQSGRMMDIVHQTMGYFTRLEADMVELVLRDDAGERRIARGVSQYSAVDIRRIARRHSREIEGILGYTYGENVVHRDDLVLG